MRNTIIASLLCFTIASLSGCATVAAYDAATVNTARTAADMALQVTKQAFCAMSVDTLNRHPEDVQAVKDMCWSNTTTTASDAASEAIPTKK